MRKGARTQPRASTRKAGRVSRTQRGRPGRSRSIRYSRLLPDLRLASRQKQDASRPRALHHIDKKTGSGNLGSPTAIFHSAFVVALVRGLDE